MPAKILLVDDDELVLRGYQRNLRRSFEVELARDGPAALRMLGSGSGFAVVVSDMHMPGMNGLELLRQAQEISPDAVGVMVTGDSDQRIAAAAVNQGRIFRFLTKPCDLQEMLEAVSAAVRQHQLVRAEKDLLEQTLSGAVESMTDLLAAVDPRGFGSAQLLKHRALAVARMLKAEREWEIGLAALLSRLGNLTVSQKLLHRARAGEPLSDGERVLLERTPEFGARLLRRIPRLERVADMVLYHAKGFDGSGFPRDGVAGRDLPFGARILKPLADVVRDEQERGLAFALDLLRHRRIRYDPEILQSVEAYLEAEMGLNSVDRAPGIPVPLKDLREGQVLAAQVVTEDGMLVLLPGIRLSVGHLQLLRNLAEILNLREPVLVRPERP